MSDLLCAGCRRSRPAHPSEDRLSAQQARRAAVVDWLAADGAPGVIVWAFAVKGPQGASPRMLHAHDQITALAWRPGNTAVLATGDAEGTIAISNAAAGAPGRTRTIATRWELGDQITALTWNSRGTLLAATRNGTIHCLAPST